MIVLITIGLVLATALLTLFAYIDRLYTEMGKFFLRDVEDNLDVFEKQIEPYLKMDRARAGLTFALLTQGMILLLALGGAYLVFRTEEVHWAEAGEALVLLAGAVLVFAHLVPHVLITRTRGEWIVPFRSLLRVGSWLAVPAVVALSFSFTVSDLATSQEEERPATPAEDIQALMDKGEEHGVLEKEDRKLIQSVVEFGDKIVRDVMTPRPKIVAVERETTLDGLLHAISETHYSRVPVFRESLDNIEGFVHTRDLIQLTDQELKQTHAWERLREVLIVPETKPVASLLRELQGKNQQMAIVIDEYGGVSGLATIEDMVEEIVGEIHDESEKQQDAAQQPDGSWIVSGQAPLDILEQAFGALPEHEGDSTTVAGLVNTLAGHVPQRGEVFEAGGLRFEVLESSETLVERLRVARIEQ